MFFEVSVGLISVKNIFYLTENADIHIIKSDENIIRLIDLSVDKNIVLWTCLSLTSPVKEKLVPAHAFCVLYHSQLQVEGQDRQFWDLNLEFEKYLMINQLIPNLAKIREENWLTLILFMSIPLSFLLFGGIHHQLSCYLWVWTQCRNGEDKRHECELIFV